MLYLYLQDPEFYDYLKQHGEELLQFADEDIEVSMRDCSLLFRYCSMMLDTKLSLSLFYAG